MNIGFAKLGKSIKFASAFSPTGGDLEAPNVLRSLANNNPDKTFYLLGRSDFRKLSDSEVKSIFPYNNVVDGFAEFTPKFIAANPDVLCQWQKESMIQIDFSVMMVGQIGTVTIPNKIEQVKDRSLTAAVIDMTKAYATPTIYWMNDNLNTPWIEILNDPRYTHAACRDFLSLPKKILGQYDYTFTHNKIKSYEDQDRELITSTATYNGMETAFLIGKDKDQFTKHRERRTKFGMILNEGSPSRFKELSHWVLNRFDDISIYGKWEHASTLEDTRFKGSIHIDETQKIMSDTKYTFIIPIADGWVTSKYIEMIHAGVIPFLHPSYDTQNHTKVPDILRVTSPQELLARVDFLEANSDAYVELKAELYSLLKESYYDGTFMNETIMKSMFSRYKAPPLQSFAKAEVHDLSSFF